MRFKSPALRDRDLVRRLETTLAGLKGIRNAKISRLTGSILVEYDVSAWATPAQTRELWRGLCTLFPAHCEETAFEITLAQLGTRAAIRDTVHGILERTPGVTEATIDPRSGVLRVELDPQRFAAGPLLAAFEHYAENRGKPKT